MIAIPNPRQFDLYESAEEKPEYTDRYQCFLKATGTDPAQFRGYDFIHWINGKWWKFCKEFSRNYDFKTDKDHRDFDAWLPQEAARDSLTRKTA